jgi:hypothetical protein
MAELKAEKVSAQTLERQANLATRELGDVRASLGIHQTALAEATFDLSESRKVASELRHEVGVVAQWLNDHVA